MNCNCKNTEIIIAIVILIFAWWQTAFSQWIVTIAAVLLLLHAFKCKNCRVCAPAIPPASSRVKSSARRAFRRRPVRRSKGRARR